jgi:hypothetical protein
MKPFTTTFFIDRVDRFTGGVDCWRLEMQHAGQDFLGLPFEAVFISFEPHGFALPTKL